MKYCKLELPQWKWHGYVCAGGTEKQFKKFAKRKFHIIVVDDNIESAGSTVLIDGRPFLVWIDSKTNSSTLAHELLHVTFGILYGCGVKLCPESEETFTYLLGYMMKQVREAKWRNINS